MTSRPPTRRARSPFLGSMEVRRDAEGTKIFVGGVLYAVRPPSIRKTPAPWLALAAGAWAGSRPARRAAVLGYGGGTLARLLRRGDPRLSIAGVDRDPRMLELGRRHLASDIAGVRVDQCDAATWLRRPARFDAILDDLYAPINGWLARPVSCTHVPVLAKARLRPGGVYAVSLRCPGGRPERAVISAIVQTFRHSLVIYMREYAHKVVLASDAPLGAEAFARGLARVVKGGKNRRGDDGVTPAGWGFGPMRRPPRRSGDGGRKL